MDSKGLLDLKKEILRKKLKETGFEKKSDNNFEKVLISKQQVQQLSLDSPTEGMASLLIWKFILAKQIDLKKLKQAFECVIKQHPILSSIYFEEDNQVKAKETGILDWRLISKHEELDIKRPIDPKKDVPMKIRLRKLKDNIELIIVLHHIASDEVSWQILLSDIDEFYNKKTDNIQLASRSNVQPNTNSKQLNDSNQYWLNKLSYLSDSDRMDLFAIYRNRLDIKKQHISAVCNKKIELSLVSQIKTVAKTLKISPIALLIASVAVLLNKRGLNKSVILGTAVDQRESEASLHTIGNFIALLPISVDLQVKNLTEIAQQIHDEIMRSFKYRFLSIEDVIAELKIDNLGIRHPLFDFIVLYRNTARSLKLGQDEYSGQHIASGATLFDIVFSLDEVNLVLSCEFKQNLIPQAIIENLLAEWFVLLSELNSVDKPLTDTVKLPNTRFDLIDNEKLDIIQRLQELALVEPDKLAIEFNSQSITRLELWQAVQKLAACLIEEQIEIGDIVVLAIERSLFVPISFLASLYVGAVFLPLDIEHPKDRLRNFIKDSNVKLIIATDANIFEKIIAADNLLPSSLKYLLIDPNSFEIKTFPDFKSRWVKKCYTPILAESAISAYIIFTSGTTGKPKGVLLARSGLNAVLSAMRHHFDKDDSASYLALSTLGFDIAIFEILAPIFYGFKLIIGQANWSKNPSELVKSVRRIKPDIMEVTPSLAAEILTENPSALQHIHVCCGGESLPLSTSNLLIENGVKVSNLYGPTEMTIISSYSLCHYNQLPAIGRPLSSVGALILDTELKPIADGFLGELYLYGPQLALGYLNAPDLTADRFIAHPFLFGQRMYRTGDLVYRDVDSAEIYYCGRIDSQLSIRGVRIEIAEIEYAMTQISGVEIAAIKINVTSNGPIMHGYYVGEAESNQVERQLKEILPNYLRPVSINKIETMPKSLNGKIDRSKLPEAYVNKNKSRVAQTPLEISVARVFTQLLTKNELRVTDDFFQLGGHSLNVTRLINGLEKEIGIRLFPKDIFDHPTIEEIALILQQRSNNISIAKQSNEIDSEVIKNGLFDLSYGQKRILAAEKLSSFSGLYNMPLVLKITGNLDNQILSDSLLLLLAKHRILTTIYADPLLLKGKILAWEQVKEQWQQAFELVENYANDDIVALINDAIKYQFNLEKELPIKVICFNDSSKETYLLVLLHHVVADEWSLRLMFAELTNFYDQLYKNPLHTVQINEVTQYFQLIEKLNSYQKKSIMFWQKQMENVEPMLELPFSIRHKWKHQSNESVFRRELVLDNSQIEKINKLQTEYKVSPFHFIQACVIALLARFVQRDVTIGIPVHGRDNLLYQDVVGYFSNTLPIRLLCHANMECKTLLLNTRNCVLDSLCYADVPLEVICSGNIPFSVLVDYRQGELPALETGTFQAKAIAWDVRLPKFPIIILYSIENDQHSVNLLFSDKYYDEEGSLTFSNALQKTIDFCLDNLNQNISEINYFDINKSAIEFDYQQYFKTSSQPFRYLSDIIEKSFVSNAHKMAVSGMTYQFDYQTLHYVVSKIAFLINQKYSNKHKYQDEIVAIYAENRLEQLILMLSVLYAGKSYVVLDSSHPESRLKYLIAQIKPELIITTLKDIDNLAIDIEKLTISLSEIVNRIEKKFVFQAKYPIHPQALAYIVFTSGSTGTPKGVLISHTGLSDLIAWIHQLFATDYPVRMLSLASMTFDVGLLEALAVLSKGGHLKVVQDHQRVGEVLLQEIIQHKITNLSLTPSVLETLGDFDGLAKNIVISVGAEPVSAKLFSKWSKNHTIINLYGPTEATVNSLSFVSRHYFNQSNVPIGLPDYGMNAIVLDEVLKPVPVGVKGELYLGGTGLARGYLNNPIETCINFVASPFKQLGSRLYRTGDLVSIQKNGQIVSHGRIDNQFKIRGLRIEPVEIETALLSFDEVYAAWVGIDESVTRPVLISAISINNKAAINDVSLEYREKLSHILPQYFVPQVIISMPSLPITSNGKVDKTAIINCYDQIKHSKSSESVKTEIHSTDLMLLMKIVSEVLSIPIEEIDSNANFLEIGGDSITGLQIIGKLKQENYVISAKELFEASSLLALSKTITPKTLAKKAIMSSTIALSEPQHDTSVGVFKPVPIVGEHLMATKADTLFAYCLLVNAPNDIVFKSVLIFSRLIAKHSALRTRYINCDTAQTLPINHPNITPQIIYLDDNQSLEFNKNKLAQFLNPYYAKNMVVGILNNSLTDQKKLLIIIHHLAIDIVSWTLILDDLRKIYNEQELLSASHSLKDCSLIIQNNMAQISQSPKSLIANKASILTKNFNPDKDIAQSAKRKTLVLSDKISNSLLLLLDKFKKNFNANIKLELILIAIIGRVIGKLDSLGLNIGSIDLEHHGRNQVEFFDVVGWFTSIRPVNCLVVGEFKEQLIFILKQFETSEHKITHNSFNYDERSEILFNYIGPLKQNLNQSPQDGETNLFTINADKDAVSMLYDPNLPLRNPIAITAYIINNNSTDCLQLDFIWAPRLVSNKAMNHFIGLLADEINMITSQYVFTQYSLPLTYTQEGLAQIEQTEEKGKDAYIIKMKLWFKGYIDSEKLYDSWKKVLLKHPILSASFQQNEDGYYAKIEQHNPDWIYYNYEKSNKNNAFVDYVAEIEAKIIKTFDITTAPLYRLRMISKNKNEHLLVIYLHHILADGWSSPIILRDLFAAYQDKLTINHDINLAQIVNTVRSISNEERVKFKWKKYLRGAKTTFLSNKGQDNGKRKVIEWEIGSAELLRIRSLCKKKQITVGSLLHALWAKTLQKITGQQQISFGSVTAGRPSSVKNIAEVVGLFSNTVPVVLDDVGNDLFSVTGEISNILLMASEQPLGLSELLQMSGAEQLFDSLIVLENYPLNSDALFNPLPGVKLSKYQYEDGTHYPISLIINMDHSIKFRLLYAESIDFICQLNAIKNIFIKQLNEAETDTNFSKASFTHDNLIVDQLYSTAVTGPILSGEFISITDKQCEYYLTKLARRLIQLGCGTESKIILLLPRSIETVLLSIAIWRVGACLVPLDSAIDDKHYAHIVNQIDADLIIDKKSINEVGLAIDFQLPIDDFGIPFEIAERLSKVNLFNTAYIIHTSGTTGVPKGVCMPWQGIDNLIKWQGESLKLNKKQKIAHFAPNYFDVSVQELLTAFIFGHGLVIVDEAKRRNMDELAHYLEINRVDVLFATNLVINELASVYQQKNIPNLDYLIQAGEKLEISADLAKWCQANDVIKLHNHYGPAETHVVAYNDHVDLNQKINVSIGHPIANNQLFILDNNLKQVKQGEVGEIYIIGQSIAYGYVTDPCQTACRFIAIPQNLNIAANGLRMYRTGDLAYLDSNGEFHCLGRIDDQIKIKGVRIEANEVVRALSAIPGIKNAYVVPNKQSNATGLMAAIIIDEISAQESVRLLSEDYIKKRLSTVLPSYLIPDVIKIVDFIPLTQNNKLDKDALIKKLLEKSNHYLAADKTQNVKIDIIKTIINSVLGGNDFIADNDDFFSIGGHSLLATKLVTKINHVFDVELELKDIFELRTPQKIIAVLDQYNNKLLTAVQWQRPNGRIPAGPAQIRFWTLSKVVNVGHTYHIPLSVQLIAKNDHWDRDKLFQQFNKVILQLIFRHEALRTIIKVDEQGLYQCVLAEEQIKQKLYSVNKIVTKANSLQEVSLFHNTEFDLEQDLMLRLGLFTILDPASNATNKEYLLAITFHHACCDAASVAVILHDIQIIFENLISNPAYHIDKSPSNYIDSIGERNQFLALNKIYDKDIIYWKQQLSGIPSPLDLPLDYKRLIKPKFEGNMLEFNFGEEIGRQVLFLSQQNSVTPFMVLQACIALLLHKLGCGTDIVIGTPDSGRQGLNAQDVVGCFINLLVLRFNLSGNPRFTDLLSQVRQVALDAYSHTSVSFDLLVKLLALDSSQSSHPLFTVGVGLQDESNYLLDFSDFYINPFEYKPNVARYDLNFDVILNKSTPELKFVVEYDSALFKEKTIQQMMERLKMIIQFAVLSPNSSLADFSILLKSERLKFYSRLKNNSPSVVVNTNSLNIVNGKLPQCGDASILISDEFSALNYQQLEQKVEVLAKDLIIHNIKVGDYVCLNCTRSLSYFVSVLAVLRVGAIYVPLIPEMPLERLKSIFNQTGSRIMITDVVTEQNGIELEKININSMGDLINPTDNKTIRLPSVETFPLELGAYVIFTSGTTGEPKGVLINRKHLSYMLDGARFILPVKPDYCYFAVASFCFDLAVYDVLWPLSNGLKTVILNEEQRKSPEYIKQLIANNSSTISLATPSFWSTLVNVVDESGIKDLTGLTVLSAGETLTEYLAKKLIAHGATVWNAYGPTETIVISNAYRYYRGIPALGKDFSLVKTFVLDEYLKPVPNGIVGELYIGGDQLADGYINEPSLTASRFIANPFSPGMMYRTGDLVYRHNGKLYFKKRLDNQISIRGHRVELDEIISTMLTIPSVLAAVVKVLQKGTSTSLVAYVVLQDKQNQEAELSQINLYLTSRLPEYMVPQILIPLDAIPLTINGKVDYQSLPEPIDVEKFEPPVSKTEKIIAGILAELLQIVEPSRKARFIALGVDSITVILLANKLKKLGYLCTAKLVFENQTIISLARVLDEIHTSNNKEPIIDKTAQILQDVNKDKLQSALNKWKNKHSSGE